MNTATKGAISEAKFLTKFLEMGYNVSIPFNGGTRYDMIIDDGEKLQKVQVKTGTAFKGCIRFNTCSVKKIGGRNFYTEKDVDLFAVYSPDLDKYYVIPFAEANQTGSMSLRVLPTGNRQEKGIVWATTFEI